MNKVVKSFSALSILIFLSPLYASGTPISDQAIYQHLTTVANGEFKKYEGITYAAPTSNNLDFIQTPVIWGLDTDTYNKGFTPLHGNKVDPEFGVPTCQTNADCQGYSTCQEPDFTTDLNGYKRKLCLTPAYKILNNIYKTIISAKHSIDLTTLQPTNMRQSSFSTGAFTATIQHAIQQLAIKSVNYSHPVRIRFLQGSFMPYTVTQNTQQQVLQMKKDWIQFQRNYLEELTRHFPKNNKLIITVGTMRSCLFAHNCGNEDKQHANELRFAFNHGKIIDVDNSTLITGGHNLLAEDYLQKDPVNDLSVKLHGPVVKGATIYVNTLWHYLCHHPFPANLSNLFLTYQNGQIDKINSACPESVDPNVTVKQKDSSQFNHITIMPIAKLNNGVGVGKDADESEPARVFAFLQAKQSIKISQQAVFFHDILRIFHHPMLHPLNSVDGTVMQALAAAVMRHVNVYIVTSNFYPGDDNYSPYFTPKDTYHYLLGLLKNEGIDPAIAQQQLDAYLHLGYISYANGTQDRARSHNKFWMVDNKVFYVGSHNIYPSSLQQFGVIIDSAVAANYINSTLWQPLWKNAIQYHHS